MRDTIQREAETQKHKILKMKPKNRGGSKLKITIEHYPRRTRTRARGHKQGGWLDCST